VSWKLGEIDLAEARFKRLRHYAREVRSNELLVRSWVGLAQIAQIRGNYPRMGALSRRIVARGVSSGLTRLSAAGYQGLMMRAAQSGQFDLAVERGWAAYCAADGHRRTEQTTLGNIGHVFLEAGNAQVARSAFSALLVQP